MESGFRNIPDLLKIQSNKQMVVGLNAAWYDPCVITIVPLNTWHLKG